jgi:death-on-curing protein
VGKVRYLRLTEVLRLHQRIVGTSGGASPVRDLGALESAVAQPRATFVGEDLYIGIPAKGGALCYSLVLNHPFVDGNKRVGHAALETFLVLNGFELTASVDEGEQTFLALAAGELTREAFVDWIGANHRSRPR